MKAAEALNQGYEIKEQRLYQAYVPCNTTLEDAEVLEAKGSRKGQLYFLWPNFASDRYCYRVYLGKP